MEPTAALLLNNLEYNGATNHLHMHSSIVSDIQIQLEYNSYALGLNTMITYLH